MVFHEVLVPAFGFALGEGEGNGDLAGSLQALPPEGVGDHFHAGEGNGVDGIASRSGNGGRLRLRKDGGGKAGGEGDDSCCHSVTGVRG